LDAVQHYQTRHYAALFESVYPRIPRGCHAIRHPRFKNGQSLITVRISPDAAVHKARLCESLGWQVHITDSAGHQFVVSEFDRLLSINPETASRIAGL
jgi:hypothetical protein